VPSLSDPAEIAKFAQAQIARIDAEVGTQPDAAAAQKAATLPFFSAGTAALDPNTGKPVGQPAETPVIGGETTVAPNATGALDAAPAGAEADAAAEAAAAGRIRDPKTGKFQPDAPAKPAATKAKPVAAASRTDAPAAATPEQRTESAEQVAGAILDDWADAVDLEFEHDDGSKYTVRAKKDQADQIRRFNRRQAMVDKASAYLGRARPTIQPLVESGQIDPIIPLLNRAVQDEEFGRFIAEAYNRRVSGLPLSIQQQQVLAAQNAPQAQAAAPAQAPQEYTAESLGITDPYVAEQVAPLVSVIQKLQAQAQAAEQQRQGWEQQQAAQRQQQAQQAQQNAWRNQRAGEAHQDLARFYPGEFTGDIGRDKSAWDQVVRYARDGNYGSMYPTDPRAALVMAGHAYMASRVDTGSPAAAMMAQVDRATMAAAQAQAQGARTVGGSAPVAQRPGPRQPPAKPSPRQANGKLKSPEQFMAEQQQYAAALQSA
jgi:hypothetical protein